MNKTRAIANNTAFQVTGRAVGTLLGLITVAIMTRHLGREGYGEFTTVMSFLQFFGIIVDFGLTLTMVRMISTAGANEDKVASNIFTLRMVSGIIFFGIAPVVALFFPYSPLVKTAIALASLSFLSMTLSQVLLGVFQKHLSAHRAATAEVAGRALLLVGVVAAAWYGMGLLAFITALIAGNLLQFVITFAFARRHAAIRPSFDLSLWREIVRQSWPIGLGIIFNLVYLKGDIIVMSVTRTQAEVGLYGASYKILDVVTAIPMIFMGLVLPLLTVAWTSGDKEGFKRKLSLAFDFLSLLAIPLAFGAFAVGNDLMRFVAGADFAEAGIFMAILMIAAASVFFGTLFGHAVVALGKQKQMVWAYALDAAVALALYIILIPKFGAIAAAWITVGSEIFIAIATCMMVGRVARYFPPLSVFMRALVASALMASVVQMADGVHVLARILIGIVIYGVLIVLLGGIKKETLNMLTRRSSKQA